MRNDHGSRCIFLRKQEVHEQLRFPEAEARPGREGPHRRRPRRSRGGVRPHPPQAPGRQRRSADGDGQAPRPVGVPGAQEGLHRHPTLRGPRRGPGGEGLRPEVVPHVRTGGGEPRVHRPAQAPVRHARHALPLQEQHGPGGDAVLRGADRLGVHGQGVQQAHRHPQRHRGR